MNAARRFFVEGARTAGEEVEIAGADAHKIEHVLRLRAGERVEIVDSAARGFAASLTAVGRVVRATLLEELAGRAAPPLCVELAQAVPKGNRMDFVIEKGTELGVDAFLPFYSERSVGRAAGREKLARWHRLARTAAQQCGRRSVPEIAEPLAFSALLERFARYDAVLFAWELAEPLPMLARVAERLPLRGRLLLVVGPEGGFTHAEAESAARHGASLLWLGPRVLRTDTAALVLLAVIGAAAS